MQKLERRINGESVTKTNNRLQIEEEELLESLG